ncbi:hypothetical protein JCM19301_1540 [Jejuia pallidilutea]|uniref:Uncharacterized protein n=1 Tax=Jejuia pallidilutea TaxID=504487 RepID=A0A090W9L0_9FLAO|nr:hypothetical protein JCM19301_1540 [Jejuia pallidilutea]GAL72149.1 hypothetical protein JCM19302_107 [Jejuia pallidilutea]
MLVHYTANFLKHLTHHLTHKIYCAIFTLNIRYIERHSKYKLRPFKKL